MKIWLQNYRFILFAQGRCGHVNMFTNAIIVLIEFQDKFMNLIKLIIFINSIKFMNLIKLFKFFR